MIIGVVKETFPGERRVALVPGVLPAIAKTGASVIIEQGAGDEAGFPDSAYQEQGAKVVSRDEVFSTADLVCMVRTYGANPEHGRHDLQHYRAGQTIVGLSEPLTEKEPIETLAGTGVRTFALELVPRTTRAQAMDVLSSQATIGGYKAVALAVDTLVKMFPMMMTAAGTIAPAKVFVIGAGVAGLQAIASAKRAGAIVHAFDVRPEVKEQVESLGGKFVQIEVEAAVGEGGYAKEQTAEDRQRQQELMADVIAESDVVITTAAVPGKKAPMLIPGDVVKRMHPGAIIIDMAAERGGNCELTKPDEVVEVGGVKVMGPTNMAATIPYHASQMYGKNVANLLALMVKEGELEIDREDDILVGTMLTEDGEIVHGFAREVFGLPALQQEETTPPVEEPATEGSPS
jgi:NAD(P) transhydrogenase subunit alpha